MAKNDKPVDLIPFSSSGTLRVRNSCSGPSTCYIPVPLVFHTEYIHYYNVPLCTGTTGKSLCVTK